MTLPAIPDYHAVAVLLLTAVALILFTRERIPLETTSLLVLVALTVGFQLFPYGHGEAKLNASHFFLGFGHQALVAVSALMIVGHALVRTGALEPIGTSLARIWRRRPRLSLLLTLLAGAALSAFVNNTPIVVLMLPILINASMRSGQSTSGMLMPMGLATIVGGMGTTIGTSTNLLVVSVAADMGVQPFGMFDFMLPVAVAGVAAILYLWLIAPLLLPERQPPMMDTSPRVFAAQLKVLKRSSVCKRTLAEAIEMTQGEMRVQRIHRGSLSITTLPDVVLKAGDMLLVADTPARLREFQQALGGALYSGEQRVDDEHPLSADDQKIAEVAIMAGSRVDGMRLSDARLASRHGLILLAFHRAAERISAQTPGLDKRVLRGGDILLVQGTPEDIAAAKINAGLLVLDGSADLPRTRKAPMALAIMTAVITAAALGWLPIAISALLGVLALLLSSSIRWLDVVRALNVQVVLIIVASLALGAALMKTGGADYLARLFIASTFGLDPLWVIGGLMLAMAVMTNVVSNNAAAVIGTPIAISIAQRLGMPVEPFVLAVLFGANMSFSTPMAYQTNLLVMNAGGYKFADFVRVGVPLTLIIWVILTLVLTYSYGL